MNRYLLAAKIGFFQEMGGGKQERERNKIFFADWKNNTIFALLFQELYQTVEIYLLST